MSFAWLGGLTREVIALTREVIAAIRAGDEELAKKKAAQAAQRMAELAAFNEEQRIKRRKAREK